MPNMHRVTKIGTIEISELHQLMKDHPEILNPIYKHLDLHLQEDIFRNNDTQLSCYFLNIKDSIEMLENYHFILPAYLKKAGLKRRKEFILGRLLAFYLFQQQGLNPIQLTHPFQALPQWPSAFKGSISHSSQSILVAISKEIKYLGVDIERVICATDAQQMLNYVLTQSEQQKWLNRMQNILTLEQCVSLIFSLKESLYKAIYAKALGYIDFLEAEVIELDFIQQQAQLKLQAEIQTKYQLEKIYRGNWQFNGTQVMSCIWD